MVKTRHSADPDDLAYGEFIAIATGQSHGSEEYGNQVNGYQEDDSEDFEEEEEQQPPRRRATRANRNLTIFSGSTTDDETPAKDTRRKISRDSPSMEVGRRSSRHRSRRIVNEPQVVYSEIRRSGRQKKLTYDTLNQGLLNKQLAYLSASEMNGFDQDRIVDRPGPRRKRHRSEVDPMPEEEIVDMYTRVKRERAHVKRNMYGVPIEEKNDDDEVEEGHEESEEESEEEEAQTSRSYYLRESRPRTQIYEAPIEPKKNRPRNIFRDSTPPPSNRRKFDVSYQSPARKNVNRRRKRAFHGSSSTSSSSSSADSGDDERRFERRKAKSMAKSRQRCLPMNLSQEDVATGFIRDRVKVGSSLADVDPMSVDRSVTFDKVGGLGKHVRALKEMVVFPLLYPEVFEKFKIAPPRGVLFYGPPGTGKTLVARALANECSSGERKVAFFMRKGADCLSKWVGESERQLRLLFDQAYQMRPSIIFFDEIDGLAPVRSSRQDQIHSSIVSTLLALMDGLDNRGEIVVIGATNRIDSIDPALRRPGRFDREFLFPLPSVQARKQILQIHTKAWIPKLSEQFLKELGDQCVGYCGADLKALCTEAALQALRRRYPQIYHSQDKLQLDLASIVVGACDFRRAMATIVPTAQRSVTSPAHALSSTVEPLLREVMARALNTLRRIFPPSLAQLSSVDTQAAADDSDEEFCSDIEDEPNDIYEQQTKGKAKRKSDRAVNPAGPLMSFSETAFSRPTTHRPRLLITGDQGQGQTTHLAPGLLHHMERMPVHVLDLPALYAVSSKTPEESCAHVFREARRTCPSIVYVPHIDSWWEVIGDTLRATFLALLRDVQPSTPLLFMATSNQLVHTLPDTLQYLFSESSGEVIVMENPGEDERREYFKDLLLHQTRKPPATRKQAAKQALEILPRAPAAEPRPLTETELQRLQKQEDSTLRELRLFLREVLNKLGRDRKFTVFAKPVDEEEVPDYYDIITNPMDLATMMNKIDLYKYQTVKEFMADIDLIVSNALEYNPDKDPADRVLRHRACNLKDTAQAILTAELDEEFEKLCEEIKDARQRRGEKATANVPSYYFTKPLGRGRQSLLQTVKDAGADGRLGGAGADGRLGGAGGDPDHEDADSEVIVPKVRTIVKRVAIARPSGRRHQSPWCRPSKRIFRKVIVYLDEDGNEIGQEGGYHGNKEVKSEATATTAEVTGDREDNNENRVEGGEDCGKTEPAVEEDAAEKTKEVDDVLKDDVDSLDPPTIRRQSQSPRGRQTSPRAGRSPRTDKSPASSVERGSRERSRTEEQHNTTPVRKSPRASCSSHVEPEPMESEPVEEPVTEETPKQEPTEPDPKPSSSSPKKPDTPEKPVNTNEDVVMENADNETKDNISPVETKESPVPMRVTRSQLNPAQYQRALDLLEEPPAPHVAVDEARLEALLTRAVDVSAGRTLEDLERLHSRLSQCIYEHRRNLDKTQLLLDLELTLSEF